jgi:hypothetical protein
VLSICGLAPECRCKPPFFNLVYPSAVVWTAKLHAWCMGVTSQTAFAPTFVTLRRGFGYTQVLFHHSAFMKPIDVLSGSDAHAIEGQVGREHEGRQQEAKYMGEVSLGSQTVRCPRIECLYRRATWIQTNLNDEQNPNRIDCHGLRLKGRPTSTPLQSPLGPLKVYPLIGIMAPDADWARAWSTETVLVRRSGFRR